MGLLLYGGQIWAQDIETAADSVQTKKRFFRRIFAQKDTSEVRKTIQGDSFDILFVQAVHLYNNGIPDSVLTFLSKENLRAANFGQATKPQKAEIYRLKALASVLTDDMKLAQIYVKKLLALEPNYRPREEDLADFLWQKDQMVVMPKFSFGLKFGSNFSLPKTTKSYSIFGNSAGVNQPLYNPENTYKSYLSNIGMGVGLNLEYALTKRIRMGVEAMYENYTFQYDSELIDATFRQSMNYVNLMIQGKYILPTDYFFGNFKWQPYVHYGFFSRFLFTALKTETNTNTERNITPQTNGTAHGMFWGGGIRKAGKKSWIALEIVRKISPTNIMDADYRFYNNEAGDYMFDFYSVGNDIELRSWEIQLNLGLHLNYKVFKKRIFKK